MDSHAAGPDDMGVLRRAAGGRARDRHARLGFRSERRGLRAPHLLRLTRRGRGSGRPDQGPAARPRLIRRSPVGASRFTARVAFTMLVMVAAVSAGCQSVDVSRGPTLGEGQTVTLQASPTSGLRAAYRVRTVAT